LTQKVQEKHYPASFAIIHNWLRFGVKGPRAMTNEARSIAELMVGPVSRELVRVFLLQDQLKAFAKKVRSNINHVHVVGAGVMGGDIAALCAYKGFKVTLQDQTPEKIAPAMARAHQFFIKKNEQPRAAQAAFDRLIPDPYGHGILQADLIIEAVFEDLAVKQEIFKQLEALAKPEALLASNTSSINLAEIATILKNPERFIGLHFFNPVAKMRLVEIAGVETSHEDSLKKAAAFVNQLGYYPLVVASCPGLLINRILTPYLMEAMILFEEGVPISAIDQAAKDFGMPMGPIELADRIGLDICLSVAEHLASFYHFNVPEKLIRKVEEKHLGVKTGKGFYRYGPGGQLNVHKTVSFPAPDLSERLILRLCNEAVACWAEKIVENTDLLDAGMIYGAGFAPFRGGPIEYIRQTGANYLLERLLLLQERYGERFKPHADWSKLHAIS